MTEALSETQGPTVKQRTHIYTIINEHYCVKTNVYARNHQHHAKVSNSLEFPSHSISYLFAVIFYNFNLKNKVSTKSEYKHKMMT